MQMQRKLGVQMYCMCIFKQSCFLKSYVWTLDELKMSNSVCLVSISSPKMLYYKYIRFDPSLVVS
jgi:hypothetical protein